eukprot:1160566-Pelagomonas_calceolata.AAC.3
MASPQKKGCMCRSYPTKLICRRLFLRDKEAAGRTKISKTDRKIYEVENCGDTRPTNQLKASSRNTAPSVAIFTGFSSSSPAKKEKNYAGSVSTAHINQGKEDTRGRDTVYPLHKRNKRKKPMGIRRITSSSPS